MAYRNLENWARIAEIVGAFAIVVSLVYVALELRESNRILQVSSRQVLSEQDLKFYETAIDPQVVAEALSKSEQRVALTDLEKSQLLRQQGLNFRIFEHAYFLYRNDALDEREWGRYQRIIRSNICRNPFAQDMWARTGNTWDFEFRHVVEREGQKCE